MPGKYQIIVEQPNIKSMKSYTQIILFAFAVLLLACKVEPDNPVFPQNNAMRMLDNAPESYAGQAALLKELGYDGLEAYGPATYPDLRDALYAEGLKPLGNYIRIDLDSAQAYDPMVEEIIRNSKSGEVVYFHLHSEKYKGNTHKGDQVAVGILRTLAGEAQDDGVKFAVYPHVGFYCETVEHSLRLGRTVAMPNFGVMINLCHLLKVEGDEGYEEKIRTAAPYLVAATINGADAGDTQSMGWDRLIQPLGSGTFDVYNYMKTLWDFGYTGPVGIQCYSIKGDVRAVLAQSMRTWSEYQERYAGER
jgi:sugar phosphate isomerase/epimerase